MNRDHRSRTSARSSRHLSGRYVDNQQPYTTTNTPPATYNSHLAGLETSTVQDDSRGSVQYPGTATNSQVYAANSAGMNIGEDGDVTQPTEYPYRARAIYSYDANSDDANEISFAKHEILDISDVSGRWWQARKATGEIGIAPSNYLVLL